METITLENNSSIGNIMEILNKTANIVQSNTITTEVILSKLNRTENLVTGLSNCVDNIVTDVTGIKDDIVNLKLNEEITTTQQETIIEAAQHRVSEILGNDSLERQKYFRIFIKSLYSDTRHYAGLGSKIARTKKGDFQRAIDYIEAWIPSCGCAELRSRADKNAEARRIAKENGYMD